MHSNLHPRSFGARNVTALSVLFARYVSGQISDSAWTQIMSILDADDTTMEERVALASFISDACRDLGPESVNVPKLNEVQDFVTLTRAA
ncbi:MAG: hypothetical protein WED81_00190 [Rhodothermales bacterium]